MIAHILYTKGAPHQREVDHFAAELTKLKVANHLVEADSREGVALSELYQLLSRPAVVLIRDDGQMVEQWQHQLPQPSDVSFLAHT